MVQQIESFEPKSHIQSFADWEDSGDLSIHLVGWEATEGVSADISIGSEHAGGDLREGGRVKVSPVHRTLPRPIGYVRVNRDPGDQVRAIVSDVSQ